MDKKTLFEIPSALYDKLTEASMKIWEYAETAYTEHKSTKVLVDLFESEGFEVTKNISNIDTAFTASFGEGSPCIALLGEYDALSGLSQLAGCPTETPVEPGAAGHGCGHNLLGIASAGAAIMLKRAIENGELKGKVIYFGCPAEEGGSGKTFMARDDVFSQADFALDWHPGGINAVEAGRSLANYQVMYHYHGIASHAGGAPDKGRSALDAVELMNIGVQFLREHIPTNFRIHYAITDTGGYSPNVVQPHATVLYLMRAPSVEEVQGLYERVNDIAHGAALMTGTSVEIDFVKACSGLVPNLTLAEVMYKNLTEVGAPKFTDADHALAEAIAESYGGAPVPSSAPEGFSGALATYINPFKPDPDSIGGGSTDVGDVSACIPTARLNMACNPLGAPGHSWQVTSASASHIGFAGMEAAAKVLACTAYDIMNDPELIEKAKAELNDRRGGVPYVCPIPDGVVPRVLKFN